MSGQRIIVLEANEVPPQLLRWYAGIRPDGALAGLVAAGGLIETENHDDLGGRELYPSQAWATLATGVPYERHGVYWYGDPKPADHPLYWQLAARAGRRVGIVGALHSSPFAEQAAEDGIVFALPDCFAPDPAARPARYRRFQQLNLAMTRGSGRVVRARLGLDDVVTLAGTARLGVRARTFGRLAALAAGVAVRRVPRERLRGAQFLLLSDMFLRLVRDEDPDLAVLFTNHVAAAMHRYWYATFPSHWPARDDGSTPYDDAWVARYRNEIPQAMASLDRVVGELVRVCDSTGRGLVVCTAMGQRAVADLDAAPPEIAVVRDADRFIQALGTPGRHRVLSAMVPQIGVAFDTDAEADAAASLLAEAGRTDAQITVDRRARVLTISYHLSPARRSVQIDGRQVPFADAGIVVESTDDQRCAEHDPVGALLTYGLDARAGDPSGRDRVDVRDIAPALLAALGVDPPTWHREPELRLGTARMVLR